MKSKYLFRGIYASGALALLTACQHYNLSNSNTGVPTSGNSSGKIVSNGQILDSSEGEEEEEEASASASNNKAKEGRGLDKSDYTHLFANLALDGEQSELRKELLMSLSKPGENIFRDAADKKIRKQKGIRLPGEKSGIEEMALYRREITMPIGTDKMLYKEGYIETEYKKAITSDILAKAKAAKFKTSKATAYSLANVVFKERGPANIPGRGRSLVVSPTNPNKWYNGSVGGGVWITDNAGAAWRTTTDYALPNLATSTIAISQSNANVIYAGTGEPFGNFDALGGSGIVKSADGGETWTALANTSFGSVGRLLANPTNVSQIYAATANGIFRSNDGGTNWANVYTAAGANKNVQDIKASADFSTLYASVNSYGVVKSIDGGNTWTQVFDVTGKSIKRIEMSISPADNNNVFLSTESNGGTGFYMSRDAGTTFNLLTFASGDSKDILGTQGWYDNIITAHPTDKNVAYVGGIYVAKVTVDPVANTYKVLSIASGYDNSKLNTYVHPDQHGLVAQVNPANAAQFRLLLNNDGGVWYTDYKTNPGETQNDWKAKASGLNNTQFYGADKKKGEDAYVAGAQDNGSAATVTTPSSATSNYLALLGGDGFEVIWNYKDPKKLIFGSQYNNFVASRNGVTTAGLVSARNADNGAAKSPFYSKLANANNNPETIFTVSSTGVWRSPDFGASWTVATFNTTANSTWLGNGTPATVKVSVANPDVVWAAAAVSGGASNTYKVNISRDNGTTFSKTTGTVPITGAAYISGLAASSVSASRAYTVFSLANQAKIVKTDDYGASWVDITGYSPVANTGFPNVSVHSVIEMPFDPNVIWAGTDIGVFETTDGGANWYIVTALPPVSVWGMKIVDDQVVLATHGRGVWSATIPELANYVLPTYIAAPNVKSTKQKAIHTNSAEAVFNYTSADITALKVYVDNNFVSTISNTTPNTDYTFSSATLSEGIHTVSVSGTYTNGANETVKASSPVEIINFNSGAASISLPTFTANDVYIGANGKFVIDNLAAKFTYNVLNNVGHPYVDNTNYQTYLKTPIIVGANSKERLTHMAFTEAGYDFAVVEASKDLVNWVPVATYDESNFPEWSNVNTAAAVTEAKFKNTVLDFPSKFAVGDEVAVRFRLTTDPGETRFGWIVKSIVPETALATSDVGTKTEQIVLAPNPAGDTTDLYLPASVKGQVTIGIYDASGKMIKTLSKSAASKITLDVSNFEKGIYLVLVKSGSVNKAIKLMKK